MKLPNILVTALFISSLIGSFYSDVHGQNVTAPKNFPGAFAGIEWNTISGSWGIEYERVFFNKNKLAIGARAAYVTRYDYGNMQLLSNPCCESASQVLVMAAGSYYTGSRQDSRGFFVHTALGAGLMNLKYNNQPYFLMKAHCLDLHLS